MKAAQGSYLITGFPRCRTAWLSALLWSDKLPCFHELVYEVPDIAAQGRPFGLASPSLLIATPLVALEVFEECPIVFVKRPEAQARRSLERWSGLRMARWDQLLDNAAQFLELVPKTRLLTIESADLDSYAAANKVYTHCLGESLPPVRFSAFNKLKIEQHLEKAKAAGG